MHESIAHDASKKPRISTKPPTPKHRHTHTHTHKHPTPTHGYIALPSAVTDTAQHTPPAGAAAAGGPPPGPPGGPAGARRAPPRSCRCAWAPWGAEDAPGHTAVGRAGPGGGCESIYPSIYHV